MMWINCENQLICLLLSPINCYTDRCEHLLSYSIIHISTHINKHPSIHLRKEYFQEKREWKERHKVNFCLFVKLFVFASFHPPVHPNVRVENWRQKIDQPTHVHVITCVHGLFVTKITC